MYFIDFYKIKFKHKDNFKVSTYLNNLVKIDLISKKIIIKFLLINLSLV